MKKVLTALIAGLTLLCMTGLAQATLSTIGTAEYGGENYKLIYDDDDTGYGGGGLVWLDYTHSYDDISDNTWANQKNWASGVGLSLSVTLNPGYTTDIDWKTGWRLPDTVDGSWVDGYEGDPDNDGLYTYTGGDNLANSEMGHLFYEELGNLGRLDTNGDYVGDENWGLKNTGNFDNLIACWSWSGTEYAYGPEIAWIFNLFSGGQCRGPDGSEAYGLAVRSGQVSIPEPATMLLLGTGLAGVAALKRRKKGCCV